MSKKATKFQRKAMSKMYRGKEIFKPLNTGWINETVADFFNPAQRDDFQFSFRRHLFSSFS